MAFTISSQPPLFFPATDQDKVFSLHRRHKQCKVCQDESLNQDNPSDTLTSMTILTALILLSKNGATLMVCPKPILWTKASTDVADMSNSDETRSFIKFKSPFAKMQEIIFMMSYLMNRNSVCKIRALQIFWRSKNPADEANLQTKSPADSNWWNKNRNFVLILRNLWSKNPPVAVFGLQETSPTPRLQCCRKGNWRSCRCLCA